MERLAPKKNDLERMVILTVGLKWGWYWQFFLWENSNCCDHASTEGLGVRMVRPSAPKFDSVRNFNNLTGTLGAVSPAK
jgi:hypothetical protein